MEKYRRPNPPCPQCGKPEGAFMGSSDWGHTFSCCSDACGIAYRDSPNRWQLELEAAEFQLALAQQGVDRCRRRLAELRGEMPAPSRTRPRGNREQRRKSRRR